MHMAPLLEIGRWKIFSSRPEILIEKISILRVIKKKWTHHKFLHVGPKKYVEQESDTYFDLSWAKKKKQETVICAKKS